MNIFINYVIYLFKIVLHFLFCFAFFRLSEYINNSTFFYNTQLFFLLTFSTIFCYVFAVRFSFRLFLNQNRLLYFSLPWISYWFIIPLVNFTCLTYLYQDRAYVVLEHILTSICAECFQILNSILRIQPQHFSSSF